MQTALEMSYVPHYLSYVHIHRRTDSQAVICGIKLW